MDRVFDPEVYKNVQVVVAKDPWVRKVLLKKLTDKISFRYDDAGFGTVSIDSDEIDAAQTFRTYTSKSPLFGEVLILVVDGLPELSMNSPDLHLWKIALNRLPKSTVVIFTLEEQKIIHPLWPAIIHLAQLWDGDLYHKTIWKNTLRQAVNRLGVDVSKETRQFIYKAYGKDTKKAVYELERIVLTGQHDNSPDLDYKEDADLFACISNIEKKDLKAVLSLTRSFYEKEELVLKLAGVIGWHYKNRAVKESMTFTKELTTLFNLDCRVKSSRFPKALHLELYLIRSLLA